MCPDSPVLGPGGPGQDPHFFFRRDALKEQRFGAGQIPNSGRKRRRQARGFRRLRGGNVGDPLELEGRDVERLELRPRPRAVRVVRVVHQLLRDLLGTLTAALEESQASMLGCFSMGNSSQ